MPAGRPDAPGADVDVVIVTHDCAEHVTRCLHSLEAQAADVALCAWVVDNASRDGTAAAVAAFPWVRLRRDHVNRGFAAACNTGARAGVAPLVLFLNPDTVLPAGSLAACVDALRATPGVVALGPRLVDAHGRFDARCRRGFPTVWGAICFLTGLDRVLADRRSRAYTMGWLPSGTATDVVALSGAFMLCRRDALERAGGFDERFFMYAEDIDLCVRLARAGGRVRYWPGADVVHAGGGSGRNAASRAAFYRTMAPLVRLHRPGRATPLVAAAVAVLAEVGLRTERVLRPPPPIRLPGGRRRRRARGR